MKIIFADSEFNYAAIKMSRDELLAGDESFSGSQLDAYPRHSNSGNIIILDEEWNCNQNGEERRGYDNKGPGDDYPSKPMKINKSRIECVIEFEDGEKWAIVEYNNYKTLTNDSRTIIEVVNASGKKEYIIIENEPVELTRKNVIIKDCDPVKYTHVVIHM